jgi:hypothetical protein
MLTYDSIFKYMMSSSKEYLLERLPNEIVLSALISTQNVILNFEIGYEDISVSAKPQSFIGGFS